MLLYWFLFWYSVHDDLLILRFATGTGSTRIGDAGNPEEGQKRKARAERYVVSLILCELLSGCDKIVLISLLNLLGLGLISTTVTADEVLNCHFALFNFVN